MRTPDSNDIEVMNKQTSEATLRVKSQSNFNKRKSFNAFEFSQPNKNLHADVLPPNLLGGFGVEGSFKRLTTTIEGW